MLYRTVAMAMLAVLLPTGAGAARRKKSPPPPSEIDRYVEESNARAMDHAGVSSSPGSLYGGGGRYGDLVRDQRSYQVDDLVTIVVSDQASALARGGTSSARKSSASGGIRSLVGPLAATGHLANLASLSGESKLDGQGETSRQTQLSTTLSARVTHVLPNGYLVLQGTKDIAVNSEHQTVSVRGICRIQDLTSSNTVRSDRIAQLEVKVSGKGVVGDAIRRPFILYRLLMGFLPL